MTSVYCPYSNLPGRNIFPPIRRSTNPIHSLRGDAEIAREILPISKSSCRADPTQAKLPDLPILPRQSHKFLNNPNHVWRGRTPAASTGPTGLLDLEYVAFDISHHRVRTPAEFAHRGIHARPSTSREGCRARESSLRCPSCGHACSRCPERRIRQKRLTAEPTPGGG